MTTGLAAPSATPATSVGAAGGSFSFLAGAVRLVVPSGAVAAAVSLDVRPTTAVPLDPHAVGSSFYEVAPASAAFSTPASLTIRYQAGLRPSGTAEGELRIHVLRGAVWEPLAGSVDVGAGEATASIPGAGTYGVRWTGPTADCRAAEDRHFDFWLGNWTLTDVTAGRNNPAGTNDITGDGSGCLLEEDYRSNVQGRSVSLFSRLDGRWHQTYLDSAGNRLVLVGVREGAAMVLYSAPNARSTWQPAADGTVRFLQETSRDGGLTWTVGFDSVYRRR